jgi:hypothetical protein
MKLTRCPSLVAALALCFHPHIPSANAHSAAEEMADAATNFLGALTADQRTKAVFTFTDEERFDWHFIPKARKGLPFKEMTQPQSTLAEALLKTALSQAGYLKASTIMSLEKVLFEMENQAAHRDSGLYYFTIFGKPGEGAWGWRVEGHHLSLNFVVRGDQVLADTPSFFGANPAEVKKGPRQGLRTLAEEEDLGRELVKSLTPEQQKVAIITNNAPREIITGNSRKAKALEPVGIDAGSFTPLQKENLMKLIKQYVSRYRTEMAEPDLKKIMQAGEDKIQFAWAGAIEPGKGHYYRIQGPTFLMEYDDTQDNANHIHTVWRDLQNDFGEDLLRQHYDQVPHPK